jgi:hypothetical protein
VPDTTSTERIVVDEHSHYLLDEIAGLFSLLATLALAVGDIELRDRYVQGMGSMISYFWEELTSPAPLQPAIIN